MERLNRGGVMQGAVALWVLGLSATGVVGCRAEPADAGDGGVGEDAAVMDVGGGDGCEVRSIVECFRGLAFADCGGDGAPVVGCGVVEGRYRCLWFTGGCRAEEYPGGGDCRGQGCLDQNVAWGMEPWTRERAMMVEVRVDSALDVGPEAVLTCECEGEPPCLGRFPLCRSDELEGYAAWRSPRPEEVGWGLPGLVAIEIWGRGQIAELTSGRLLALEMDLYAMPPRARACLIATSDGAASGEVVCAEAGEMVIDGIPMDAMGVAALRGRFEVVFPAVPLRVDLPPVEGLVLRGAF